MNRKTGFVILLGVAALLPVEAASQNIFQKAANTVSSWFSSDKSKGEVAPTEHIDLTQLTLDENISIPDLDKEARKIRTAQSREMRRLQKARLTDLKLVRNYEVIKATIAASNLFLPNDTVLSEKADIFLRPFLVLPCDAGHAQRRYRLGGLQPRPDPLPGTGRARLVCPQRGQYRLCGDV